MNAREIILGDLLSLASRIQNDETLLPASPSPLEEQEIQSMRRHLSALADGKASRSEASPADE